MANTSSPGAPDVYAAIASFLEKLDEYVILRNHDFRASISKGGDIDILVGNMALARKTIRQSLDSQWFIAVRSYVEGVFYPWGHIDLTPCIEWHGAVYIRNETIFTESSISELGFRKPRLAHEALICWFASLIWGGFFKERYRPILLQAFAEDRQAFEQALKFAVGDRWGKKLVLLLESNALETSAAWTKPLRRALWWNAVRRAPIQTSYGWLRHWIREIALRLNPPVPWIVIAGESAASTAEAIEACGLGLKIKRYRQGPHFIPFCSFAYKQAGSEKYIIATLRQILRQIDWIAGYWLTISNFRAKMYFVIVETARKETGWLSRLRGLLLPQPDATIFLGQPCQPGIPAEPRPGEYIFQKKPSLEEIGSCLQMIFEAQHRKRPNHNLAA